METPAIVDAALKVLDRAAFQRLAFPDGLESRFEADTRLARSHRMGFEGIVAILGLNGCLLLDYAIVRDSVWHSILLHTAIITPVALAVNLLVRRNPRGWLREGSVATAMIAICMMNLAAEGNTSTTSTLFGAICVLITAMFVGVVMRLRFPYVMSCLISMLAASVWFLGHAPSLHLSEAVIGESLMVIGLGIILVASHSLEREERRSYLLCLQRDLQAEELARTNQALHRISTVDKLTGLPNRRALEERLEQLWPESVLRGSSMAAVVLDVDHFKRVNDAYGHLYGDEALRRIGSLLPQALRSSEDMAARFGGEEFVLLLAHADRATALTVAERARQLVESVGTPLNGPATLEKMMWITVSCGVSVCVPVYGMGWTELIAAADAGLYAAKRAGRNCVKFCGCGDEDSRPVEESQVTQEPRPAEPVRMA